ncbi:helix-turn-helix domain-containing protein [Streptantibioticus silvisoli]|uniref:helix-turn-helix domain-containing protein n=1 Tax=Streptantibioticus silvisoli TaxID=2705255 RepID=UPI0027E2FC05|nr:helix-turn-helix transcriptional regulator [Streptantibioticus silvisoli]
MASNAVVSGPTSMCVAKNLERLRKARQLNQKDLSALLKALGRPMLPTVVSKIERGDRRVDVDDLVALALALNVSPLSLLLPAESGDEPVELTDGFQVTARTAWHWAEGQRTAMDWEPGAAVALGSPGADPAAAEDAYERDQEYGRRQAEYKALALPEKLRRTADHPAVRLVQQLEELVTDIVAPEAGTDRATLAARGRMARRRHAQLGLDIEEIVEGLPPLHPGMPLVQPVDEGGS